MLITVRELITDAIGQTLEKGDFVTAVWTQGNVTLFEVVGFKTNVKTSSRYWARRSDVVLLKRLFNDNVTEKTQNKPIRKTSAQVTKVPTEAGQNFLIMFKLSN